MAINDILQRIRVGAPLNPTNEFNAFRPAGTVTGGGFKDEFGKPPVGGGTPRGGVNNCPRGMVWSEVEIKCVPIRGRGECPEGQVRDTSGNCVPIREDDDGRGLEERCPPGFHMENGKCVDDTKPPREGFGCPGGQEWNEELGRCVNVGEEPPSGFDPSETLPSRWCENEGRNIRASNWTVSRCGGGDPTPPTDPICPEGEFWNGERCVTGGFRDPIEDRGGDIKNFYDRFPVDYLNKRFGRFGRQPTLESILAMLGYGEEDLAEKYRGFFGDFEKFPEQMLFRQFDVGKKGLRDALFDLTRKSQQARQQQGLLSGMPREFERLGMGDVGRQFQGLETAFRGDIFQGRLGFEQDTINRLLDIMKAGGDPFKKVDPNDPDKKGAGYDGQTWKNAYGDCYEWEDDKNRWSKIDCDDM